MPRSDCLHTAAMAENGEKVDKLFHEDWQFTCKKYVWDREYAFRHWKQFWTVWDTGNCVSDGFHEC
jgi:hypothetical protein